LTLKEYLFVDEHRLASYVEQIGPPLKYDKVPVWNAELSLLGPKAIASQERHARSLTRFEKIELLVEHLRQHQLTADHRPSRWSSRVFVLESCTATRVMLPPSIKGPSSHRGLTLWISELPTDIRANPEAGLLCLLQDSFQADAPIAENGLMGSSSYTVLDSLLRDLGQQLHLTVLGDTFSGPTDVWRNRAHIRQFVRDPISRLQALGCMPGTRRAVRVLYRVREFAPEDGDDERRTSTFGYPIFIEEAKGDA
jgi:hypothetical protein